MRGVRISTSSFLRKPLSRRPLEYSSRIDSSFASSSRKNLDQKNVHTHIFNGAADINIKVNSEEYDKTKVYREQKTYIEKVCDSAIIISPLTFRFAA